MRSQPETKSQGQSNDGAPCTQEVLTPSAGLGLPVFLRKTDTAIVAVFGVGKKMEIMLQAYGMILTDD